MDAFFESISGIINNDDVVRVVLILSSLSIRFLMKNINDLKKSVLKIASP